MERSITFHNFVDTRNKIQFMLDQYRINVEKWVVDQFNDIPVQPGEAAIMSLRLWMEKYLTVRQRLEIIADEVENPDFHRILLSRETVERMDSVRQFYGLNNMEETVATLLDCIRRHPVL
ncbi:MAG: hypothetical protein HQL76_17150 [Magnetococcales bacterium]|nr:hypothetical protein [Magnetococcales bacterium]